MQGNDFGFSQSAVSCLEEQAVQAEQDKFEKIIFRGEGFVNESKVNRNEGCLQ